MNINWPTAKHDGFLNNIKLNEPNNIHNINEKEKNSKKKKVNNLTTDTTSEKNLVSSFENKIKDISNNNSNGKKNKISE